MQSAKSTAMKYLLWNTGLAGWHRKAEDGIASITSHLDLAGRFDVHQACQFRDAHPGVVLFSDRCMPEERRFEEPAIEGKEAVIFLQDEPGDGPWLCLGVAAALESIESSMLSLAPGEEVEIPIKRIDLTEKEIEELPEYDG